MGKTDAREITEVASGHTTNKYTCWDLNSCICNLLQSHAFPTEQHNIKPQRVTLCVPTSLQGNKLHRQQRIFISHRYLYAHCPQIPQQYLLIFMHLGADNSYFPQKDGH